MNTDTNFFLGLLLGVALTLTSFVVIKDFIISNLLKSSFTMTALDKEGNEIDIQDLQNKIKTDQDYKELQEKYNELYNMINFMKANKVATYMQRAYIIMISCRQTILVLNEGEYTEELKHMDSTIEELVKDLDDLGIDHDEIDEQFNLENITKEALSHYKDEK